MLGIMIGACFLGWTDAAKESSDYNDDCYYGDNVYNTQNYVDLSMFCV